jgi:alkyldihydroxyacetonephosphate synthase
MQAGLQPNVVRLYDPFDSLLHSSDGDSGGGAVSSILQPIRDLLGGRMRALKRGLPRIALARVLGRASMVNALIKSIRVSCLLILGFEGKSAQVDADIAAARRIMENAGGVDGGEEPGKRWLAHRYNVSFKQSAIFDAGAFADTMEVSCTWSRLNDVYRSVREAVSPSVVVMAHFSHAYREGCSIYFTFAGFKRNPEALERLYEKVWVDAMGAVVRAGGSISHHHGIGLAKRDVMGREHGAGIHLLYALKDGLDPNEQLNPGKLLPDRAAVE